MSEAKENLIPRWARELGEETWEKINELLHDGYDTPDILRELDIPAGKIRSLQIYARKFGPKRRLKKFAAFKETLLNGAMEFSPQFMDAMGLIAKSAVSTKVKPAVQQRACALMTLFTSVLTRSMKDDIVNEKEREATSPVSGKLDPDEIVRRIHDIYGIKPVTADKR